MAVKIVQQPNRIALIGAATSAASFGPGHERAPAVLRAAGLVERLQAAGYEVTDLGDIPTQLYQPDEENPRARNVGGVLAALEALRPRIEQAVKAGALPLVLGGDCVVALATLAGLRRYFRGVSLVYLDRDADLNIPATTPSGCLDGMVVAHITGRGAPELVRFWGEPPLVREPEIALFGFDRLDPPEREFLEHSPVRQYPAPEVLRLGVPAAAQAALERIHAHTNPFVVHFDVDVIASEDFSATYLPGAGGLRLEQVREALGIFVGAKNLAAFEITAFNPDRDADGSAAKLLVGLMASLFAARLADLRASAEAAPVAVVATEAPAATPSPEATAPAAEPTPDTESVSASTEDSAVTLSGQPQEEPEGSGS